jgi:hypothetical protein
VTGIAGTAAADISTIDISDTSISNTGIPVTIDTNAALEYRSAWRAMARDPHRLMNHEASEGDEMKAGDEAGQPFVVFGEAAEADGPGEVVPDSL